MRVLATGLEGPWEITWGPDQQIWATERRGRRVIRDQSSRRDANHVALTARGPHDVHAGRPPWPRAASRSTERPRRQRLCLHRVHLRRCPRTGACASHGNSPLSIRGEIPDVIQADGRYYGTSDARRSCRRETRHRPRSEAVSHHRRSGQQLRRKPVQCESRAGPPHPEPGQGGRLVQLSGQDPPTESRRVDP